VKKTVATRVHDPLLELTQGERVFPRIREELIRALNDGESTRN
jgi:hypothetical protein